MITEVATGRYALFHGGEECGEDRWRIEHAGDHLVVTGALALEPPHPFPNHQDYRITLTPTWRVTGLEVEWSVGTRRLRAVHAASAGTWRARIEYGGESRVQEGDYPDACEVESTAALWQRFILSRRDFQVGGEHEFPILRIGPPFMAVSPERMRLRMVELGMRQTPWGAVNARRYVTSLPPKPEAEGYTFWTDEEDLVLEAFEGPEPELSWLKLVEYSGPAAERRPA